MPINIAFLIIAVAIRTVLCQYTVLYIRYLEREDFPLPAVRAVREPVHCGAGQVSV